MTQRGRQLSLDKDLTLIEALLATGLFDLLIISPLTGYLGKGDYTRDPDVRKVLDPLAALAEKHRTAVVGIMHLNKAQQQSSRYRVGGSIAFTAAARAIFLVASHDGKRVFIPHKMSVGARPPGLAFTINEKGLAWSPEPVALTADQVLGDGPPSSKKPTKVQQAIAFLCDRLESGPAAQTAIETEASVEGIRRTPLYEAKKALAIVSGYKPDGYGGKVLVWSLPDDQSQSEVVTGTGIESEIPDGNGTADPPDA